MERPTIFLTGGSGYVGRNLIRRLCADGYAVRALVRSAGSASTVTRLGAEAVQGDLCSAAIGTHMAGCEAVIHAAADTGDHSDSARQWKTNVEGTRNVITAARAAGVPRSVVISSASAITSGRRLRNVTEDHPYPKRPAGIYGASRAQAERVALALAGDAFRVVVLRPHLVWGRDNTTAVANLLGVVRSGRFAWISGGHYLTSAIHVDNLCEAVSCALRSGVQSRIHHVSDGAPVSFRTLITAHLQAHGVAVPGRTIPRALLRILFACDDAFRALRLRQSAPISYATFASLAVEVTLDDRRAREALGYRPVLSTEAGMAQLPSDAKPAPQEAASLGRPRRPARDPALPALYLLVREISMHSGPNPLFFGIFTDPSRAARAREAYLRQIARRDPWGEQCYRTSEPEKDVSVREVDDARSDMRADKVYLVTAYYSGFGQEARRFLAVFSDRAQALQLADEYQEGDDYSDPDLPNYCDVDEVLLNVPR